MSYTLWPQRSPVPEVFGDIFDSLGAIPNGALHRRHDFANRFIDGFAEFGEI
jgi:hypothetical protein